MFFNTRFVLASSSKSRYRILKNNNLIFSRKKPTCNEDFYKKKFIKKNFEAKKISLELARIKSRSVSKKTNNRLVVGSDTVIFFKKKLLNKATTLKDAEKKIKEISGKKHKIFSSVSVHYNNKEVWSHTQQTIVKIRHLNNHDIKLYLSKTGKSILDSVGCYQLENMGPNIIEDIDGDFFNVMGFPLFPFLKFLKKYKQQT